MIGGSLRSSNHGARTAWGSIQNRVDATRGASLARPKAGLGVVLLSLHGGAADHARFDRSEKSTFRSLSGPLAADEDGERTSDFSKPAALRGLDIAFGLTFTTPQGRTVRGSPVFTTRRGAPLPKLRAWRLARRPDGGRRAQEIARAAAAAARALLLPRQERAASQATGWWRLRARSQTAGLQAWRFRSRCESAGRPAEASQLA